MSIKHVMHVSVCFCVIECKCMCAQVSRRVYMCVHTSVSVVFIFILLLFCLHRRFIFDNHSTGEAYRSLFTFISSIAMCLAEFI